MNLLSPLRRAGLLLAATLLLAHSAAATAPNLDAIEISLEDLVQMRVLSTPKFADNPDAIPSLVSVLKREDIRVYGWRTLGDALRTLQGFNVTSDHVYQYAGVRGVSPPGDYRLRLRVLIDGLSINESLFGSAPVDDSFPLDIDLVERIEVIRGPSASVYGGDAMFGVINVVTRSGQSLGGSEIALGWGSGQQKSARASWGGRLDNGVDLLLSASGGDKTGHSQAFGAEFAEPGNTTLRHLDGSHHGKFFLRARGDDWRLSLTHSEREKTVPTGSYGSIVNDNGHVENDTYSLIEIAKDWRFNADTSLQQRLYFGEYSYRGLFPYDYSGQDTPDNAPRVLNRDFAGGRWWGLDHYLVARRAAHRWTLGLEYRGDLQKELRNEDLGYGCYGVGSAPCLHTKDDSRLWTLFAQDDIQLNDSHQLTLGLRYDKHNDGGSFWSPRLGLVSDAGEMGLFKLLFGTAFRVPTVYERQYSTPTYAYGNPDLASEKMRSLELAWEKRMSGLLGGDGRVGLALYHFTVQRMISTDLAGIASNGSEVHADGLEIEIEQRWRNGSRLRSNYSLQRAHDELGRMDNSPRHMVKLNAALPLGLPGLMAGFEAQWLSRRLSAAGQAHVPDYLLGNLNLSYRPPTSKAWEISLGLYNLFDQRYRDPIPLENMNGMAHWSTPQLQRTALLKAIFRF